MALGNYGGTSNVKYDTAVGFGTVVDLGKPREDSPGITREVATQPTADGQKIYAGVKLPIVFHISDMSKFSALETLMKANTAIYIRLTDLSSNTEDFGPSTCRVTKVNPVKPGDTAYFILEIEYWSI